MKKICLIACLPALLAATAVYARDAGHAADKVVISAQNAALEKSTDGKGYGPQSPRDLANKKGSNKRNFAAAPSYKSMNLCNIHFHKNAEHKGGEFTTYAGDGDGHGYETGFKYSGKLGMNESKPLDAEVCSSKHGGLQVGDTVELHYVHSTAQVLPGPTLNACLSETDINPQLRVEAQVFVLVNDPKAADFNALTQVGEINGYKQALNIPKNTGQAIQYAGSTTGPAYNEKGSPLQVSWSVRPRVMKVNAESVGQWCKGNAFNEDHAHGVRNLVIHEALLSSMR
ncbi:delta-class carbonic anhydrase [Limnohabitans sp.]